MSKSIRYDPPVEAQSREARSKDLQWLLFADEATLTRWVKKNKKRINELPPLLRWLITSWEQARNP